MRGASALPAVSGTFFTPAQEAEADRVIAGLPNFERIFPVAETARRTKDLAAKHPGHVEVQEIGRSRMGRAIESITVGDGPFTVLLLGFPHPDEGVGSLMLDHLLEQAAARPQLLKAFSARLVAVKCWDTDGAKLNEGWFHAFEGLEHQAHNHFRPPPAMQMEWTFPVTYKDHSWDALPPETEAVRQLILREKPAFMLGLHNAALNDPYFYLSEEAPEAYGELARAVEIEGLSMSDRSPDVPFEVAMAPGIFKMYGLRDYYDYYEANEPYRLQQLRRGACSDEYLAQHVPGSFSFNAEVPRMLDDRVRDRSPAGVRLEAVVERRKQENLADFTWFARVMDPVLRAGPEPGSLLMDSVRLHIEEFRAREEWDSTDAPPIGGPTSEVEATVADRFENEVAGPWEDLLVLGEGWRAAGELAEFEVRGAREAQATLQRRIGTLSRELTDRSNFQPVPLRVAASIQLRSLLLLMGWRRNGT